MNRIEKLEAFADIVSRIWFHGDFIIETVNERTCAGLLQDLGYYPISDDEIIKRPDYEELSELYKDFKLEE
jgi:hypothetical protein